MFTAGSCYAQLMDLQATAGPGTFAGIHIAMLVAIVAFFPAIYFVSESACREDKRQSDEC